MGQKRNELGQYWRNVEGKTLVFDDKWYLKLAAKARRKIAEHKKELASGLSASGLEMSPRYRLITERELAYARTDHAYHVNSANIFIHYSEKMRKLP